MTRFDLIGCRVVGEFLSIFRPFSVLYCPQIELIKSLGRINARWRFRGRVSMQIGVVHYMDGEWNNGWTWNHLVIVKRRLVT